MNRRRFIGMVGGGVAVGAAGCVEELLEQSVGDNGGGGESGSSTPVFETGPQVQLVSEAFDTERLAYDVTLDVALGSSEHVTVTATELGADSGSTERLATDGQHVLDGLRAGMQLEFDAPNEHVQAPIMHTVGTTAGVTLEGQERLSGLSVSSVPELSGETYDRRYEWEFPGHGRYQAQLSIPKSLFEYCQDRPRLDKYGFYGGDAFNDVYVERVADLIDEQTELSKTERVNLAISFVQSLEYTSDSVTAGYDEYQRYPVETLVEEGGDCEDTAILLGSILKELGYGVRGVLVPGHMAIAVKGDESVSGTYYTEGGSRYYYIETTGEGWQVGDIPDAHENEEARLVPLSGYPCLNFSLGSFDDTRSAGPFIYTIQNSGDAVARDVRFDIEFVGSAGQPVTGTRLRVGSLGAGESTKEVVPVLPPEESVSVKLRHSIYHDGELHTAHETEYL